MVCGCLFFDSLARVRLGFSKAPGVLERRFLVGACPRQSDARGFARSCGLLRSRCRLRFTRLLRRNLAQGADSMPLALLQIVSASRASAEAGLLSLALLTQGSFRALALLTSRLGEASQLVALPRRGAMLDGLRFHTLAPKPEERLEWVPAHAGRLAASARRVSAASRRNATEVRQHRTCRRVARVDRAPA